MLLRRGAYDFDVGFLELMAADGCHFSKDSKTWNIMKHLRGSSLGEFPNFGFFSSQECESEELKESFEDQWIDPNQNKDEDQQNQSELNKIATLDNDIHIHYV